MGKMLITGGAGFIGANFVRLALSRTESNVLVLDKLTYAGHLESLEAVAEHPRFEFVRGDIADRETVRAIFTEHHPQTVVNFAAESHVDRSIDDPGAFLRTNTDGTFELLDAARAVWEQRDAAWRQGFRFLHVSTDEVYGSLGESGAFSETTPYAPNSPYSASKAAADHLARAYAHTYGLPVLITNCSNNYGPFQFPEKLVPLLLLNALEARDLPIYGDGQNVRDWLFVEDHCEGILCVLEKGHPGEKYNIGGQSERTNLEVIDRLLSILEEERPARENPAMKARGLESYEGLKTFVPDRPGHDRRYAIDPTRIQRDLGWRPRFDFDRGFRKTVRWYLDNREWCEKVTAGAYDRERLGLGATGRKP